MDTEYRISRIKRLSGDISYIIEFKINGDSEEGKGLWLPKGGDEFTGIDSAMENLDRVIMNTVVDREVVVTTEYAKQKAEELLDALWNQ